MYLGRLNTEEKLREVIKNLKGLIPHVKQNLRDSDIRTFEKAIHHLFRSRLYGLLKPSKSSPVLYRYSSTYTITNTTTDTNTLREADSSIKRTIEQVRIGEEIGLKVKKLDYCLSLATVDP